MVSVTGALEHLLDSVALDEAGELNAAIARALASKLDEARDADSGAVAMAVAGIAKELRAVISDICEATGDADGFRVDLFAAVGDPEDS